MQDGLLKIGGPMGKILNSVQESLNFTYTVQIPEDRQWGRLLPDGTATGMIGMLVRNEADWAVNPFAQTYDRFMATSFTAEMGCTDLAILAGSPWNEDDNLFGLVVAFDWQEKHVVDTKHLLRS
ncbi:unnamed protein product [Ixodes pacificus]